MKQRYKRSLCALVAAACLTTIFGLNGNLRAAELIRGTDAEPADPTEAVSSSEPAIESSQSSEVESTTAETQTPASETSAAVTEPSEVSTTTDELDNSDHSTESSDSGAAAGAAAPKSAAGSSAALPQPVTGLTARGVLQGVQLNWSPAAGADGYIIYKQYPGESQMSYRYILSETSFKDTNASASGFNFYRVYPYKIVNGKRVMGRSAQYVYAKAEAVSPVTNLKATAGDRFVNIRWDAVSGADGYIIYKQYPGESSMSYRYMLSGTSFNDVNANASGFNFYRVYPYKMVNGERVVGRSEKYVYAKPYPVAPVANLKAFGEVNRVRLTWSPVSGSDGYIIYRRYPGEGGMSYLSETTTSSFIDTNARRNAQNSYRVYAYQIINGEKVLGRSNGYVFAAALVPPPYVPTSGDKRALEKAKDYLRFMPFSRQRLIGQLEYHQFTTAEATYAVDHCGANWYDQALKKAQSYLKYTAFSRQGLIEQLEYEKFTSGEIAYAINQCGANWYEQAVKKARSYLSIFSFSRDRLIEQLLFENFTNSEAVYAANQVY